MSAKAYRTVTIRQLARDCGETVDKMRKTLRELEARGMVKEVKRGWLASSLGVVVVDKRKPSCPGGTGDP